jgi:serine/threonine protein kinase/cytochrome c556
MSSDFPITRGNYTIEGLLGAGAFGVVYRGQHREHGTVALKFLWSASQSPDQLTRYLKQTSSTSAPRVTPESLAAFEREIDLLQALQNYTQRELPADERGQYTPRFYEAGEWNGVPFFAMEFVDGSRYRSAETLRRAPLGSPQDWEVQVTWMVTRYLRLVNYLHTQKQWFLQDSQLQNIRYNAEYANIKEDCLRILDWNGTRTFNEGRELYGYLTPHSHDLWMACAFAFTMLSGVPLERTQRLSESVLNRLGGERWQAVSAARRAVISKVLSVPVGNLPNSFTAEQLIRYLNEPQEIAVRDAELEQVIALIEPLMSANSDQELEIALGRAIGSPVAANDAHNSRLSLSQLRYKLLLEHGFRNRGGSLSEQRELKDAARSWVATLRNVSDRVEQRQVANIESDESLKHRAFSTLREDFLREMRMRVRLAALPERLDGRDRYDLSDAQEAAFRELINLATERWQDELYRQKVIEDVLGEASFADLGQTAAETPETRLRETFKRFQERRAALEAYQESLERALRALREAPENMQSAIRSLLDECAKRDPTHLGLLKALSDIYGEWRRATDAGQTEYCIRLAESIEPLRLALDAELIDRNEAFFEQLEQARELRDGVRQFVELLSKATKADEERLDQAWQTLLNRFADGADRAYLSAQILKQLNALLQENRVTAAAYRFAKKALGDAFGDAQALERFLSQMQASKREEARAAVLREGKSPKGIREIVKTAEDYDVQQVLSNDDVALHAELEKLNQEFAAFEAEYQPRIEQAAQAERAERFAEFKPHLTTFEREISNFRERLQQVCERFHSDVNALEIPFLRQIDERVRDAEKQAKTWRDKLSEIERKKRNRIVALVSSAAAVVLIFLAVALIFISSEQRAAAEQTSTAVVLNPSLTAAVRALDFQATETAFALIERESNLTRTVVAEIRDQTATVEMRTTIALSLTPTPMPTFTWTPTPTPTPTSTSTPTPTPMPTFTWTPTPTPTPTSTSTPTPTPTPIPTNNASALADLAIEIDSVRIFRVPQINYGDTQTVQIVPSETERTLEFIGMAKDVVWLKADPADDRRLSFSIHRLDNTLAMNRQEEEEFAVDAKGEQRITLPKDGRYLIVIKANNYAGNYAGNLRLTLNADVQFFDFFEDQTGKLSREEPARRYRFFASRGDEIQITFSSPAPEFERVVFYDVKGEQRQERSFKQTLEKTGYYTFALDASAFFAQQPESAPIPFTFKAEWVGKDKDRGLFFYNTVRSNTAFHTLPAENLRVVAGVSVSTPLPLITPTQLSKPSAQLLVVNIVETTGRDNDNPFAGNVGWHLVRDAKTLRLLGWARVAELTRIFSTPMPTATPTPTATPMPTPTPTLTAEQQQTLTPAPAGTP